MGDFELTPATLSKIIDFDVNKVPIRKDAHRYFGFEIYSGDGYDSDHPENSTLLMALNRSDIFNPRLQLNNGSYLPKYGYGIYSISNKIIYDTDPVLTFTGLDETFKDLR